MLFALERTWRKLLFRARREQLERELREELQVHMSMKQREREEAGFPDGAAREQTLQAMGNVTLASEQSRDAWSFRLIEDFFFDFRYALRSLRRNPAFSIVGILSLALGIGGNTAIFGFINALMIRPLPYPEPDRLLRITELFSNGPLALFREKCRSLDIASVSPGFESNLTGRGAAVRITGSKTSPNFFSVLGVSVERGRAFHLGEDRPGADAVVILSHSLWQSGFGGDPTIVGGAITLGGVNRTVVGVMPPSFAFPSRRVQFWIPSRMDPGSANDYWASEFVPLIARLRPGASIELARGEIRAATQDLWKLFPFPMPKNWASDATVISLQRDLVGDVRGRLLILLSAVAAVLLIACTNIASLLLSRAMTRRKEIALRAAIGAGRSRIVRQLLTESLALGVTGSCAGLLLATIASSLFASVLPPDLPGANLALTDWRLALFAVSLGIVTGLAFGLAPALSAGASSLVDGLKTGSQRSAGRMFVHLRSWLVAAEVALAVVLVAGAGLLLKSLYALSSVQPGFSSERVLTVKISPEESLCARPETCIASYDRLLDRARKIPGVMDAALANTLPLDGESPSVAADVQGHPKSADFPAPMLWTGAITPGYLKLMGIPLLAGRALTAADGQHGAPVILISASTAKRFWPGESALGKHIKATSEDKWRTVVGIVGDVRQYNLVNQAPGGISGAIYVPYAQSVLGDQPMPAVMNLLVKSAANQSQVSTEIRQTAIDANPSAPVGQVVPLNRIVSGSISGVRSTTEVFLLFAAAALLLAAIGLYGLISYSVAQRTYEIGVRMAVGASGSSIVGMVVRQSLRVMSLGLFVGLIGSFVATRFLSSLLFELKPTDLSTFVEVAALLLIVDLLASAGPAWRASQVDPIRTLRAE